MKEVLGKLGQIDLVRFEIGTVEANSWKWILKQLGRILRFVAPTVAALEFSMKTSIRYEPFLEDYTRAGLEPDSPALLSIQTPTIENDLLGGSAVVL